MTLPVQKRTASLIYTVERQAIVELSKTNYAIFRSTHLHLLQNYKTQIQGCRDNFWTKFTPRQDLRQALINLFVDQGIDQVEAEVTTELNLQQAIENETHMDELIELLNRYTKKRVLGEIDHVLELHMYVLQLSTMKKKNEPSFEAILQEIEFNAKQPNENLHKLWVNSKEGLQYESEEAFRLDQAFSAVRYRMMSLQQDFRDHCRRKVDEEMYRRERSQQSFSLFIKRVEATSQKI